MKNVEIILSLGSNLGDREGYIYKAIDSLSENPKMRFLKRSSLLNNKAILFEDQPDFINALAIFETELDPFELLNFCQNIEKKLGRVFRFAKGPREIDIDILTYGKQNINENNLILPHPGIWERDYLRVLLQELNLWEVYSRSRRI